MKKCKDIRYRPRLMNVNPNDYRFDRLRIKKEYRLRI